MSKDDGPTLMLEEMNSYRRLLAFQVRPQHPLLSGQKGGMEGDNQVLGGSWYRPKMGGGLEGITCG